MEEAQRYRLLKSTRLNLVQVSIGISIHLTIYRFCCRIAKHLGEVYRSTCFTVVEEAIINFLRESRLQPVRFFEAFSAVYSYGASSHARFLSRERIVILRTHLPTRSDGILIRMHSIAKYRLRGACEDYWARLN